AFLSDFEPGWQEHVATQRFLPGMLASSWLPLAATNGFAGRPPARSQDIDTLYFAGDWGRTARVSHRRHPGECARVCTAHLAPACNLSEHRRMIQQDERVRAFEEQRSYLFSIAYRLLGSVSDAEDVLQDAFLRWDRAREAETEVRSVRSFLATIVVRLC